MLTRNNKNTRKCQLLSKYKITTTYNDKSLYPWWKQYCFQSSHFQKVLAQCWYWDGNKFQTETSLKLPRYSAENIKGPVRQRLSSGISWRITCSNELNALKLHPRLIRSPVETAVLNHLTQEWNDTLCSWTHRNMAQAIHINSIFVTVNSISSLSATYFISSWTTASTFIVNLDTCCSRTWLRTIGDRAFPIATARTRNSLPSEVMS